MRLDASSRNTATIEVDLQSKDVELDSLLKLAGLPEGRVAGARTSMAIKLKSSAVKVTGTLAKPQLAVNAKGTAVAGLRIGAAVATLGITELAGSLVRKTMPSHPCKTALDAGSSGSRASAQSGRNSAPASKQPGFFDRLRGK